MKIATAVAATVIFPIVNKGAANAGSAAFHGTKEFGYYWTFCFGLMGVCAMGQTTTPTAIAYALRRDL